MTWLGTPDRKSCTLVTTIITLARAFGMTTIAEGVRNEALLDYLVHQGCNESQGYLHSHPLRRSEFERWLMGSHASSRPASRSQPRSSR